MFCVRDNIKFHNSCDYFSSICFNCHQSSGPRSFWTVNKLKFDFVRFNAVLCWNYKQNISSILINHFDIEAFNRPMNKMSRAFIVGFSNYYHCSNFCLAKSMIFILNTFATWPIYKYVVHSIIQIYINSTENTEWLRDVVISNDHVILSMWKFGSILLPNARDGSEKCIKWKR